MKIEIKPGDKFVYRSKYGGLVKGEIAAITLITSVELTSGYNAKLWRIKSTNGVWYDFNEIEIVSSFFEPFTPEQARKMSEGLQKHKQDRKEELQQLLRNYKGDWRET